MTVWLPFRQPRPMQALRIFGRAAVQHHGVALLGDGAEAQFAWRFVELEADGLARHHRLAEAHEHGAEARRVIAAIGRQDGPAGQAGSLLTSVSIGSQPRSSYSKAVRCILVSGKGMGMPGQVS